MIDLVPSAEQQQIVDSVAGWLGDTLPIDRFVPQPTPVPNRDRTYWPALGELGVFGLGLAEDRGGIGYSLVEEVLVARELGRCLVTPAILSTMIAAHVAAACGEADMIAAIRAGDAVVAPALAFTPAAAGEAGEYHLVDAQAGDLALVTTSAGAGIVAPGEWRERRPVPSIDFTLTLDRARLAGRPALWAADPALSRAALLLGTAYLVGIAEATVRDTVEYAQVREQFGQPIGAFQAIKHRAADMLALSSAAWCLTAFAALTETKGAPDAAFQTIAARVMAADAAFRNAKANIQNHGAIGYTGEHHAHLRVKRAHVIDRMGGDIGMQKKRLLAAVPPSDEGAASAAGPVAADA